MAVTAKSYFSNAIVGVPQVAAGQVNVYKEDTSPKFAIGTKFERQDGAIFRYSHFGAAVGSAGLLCCSDVTESGTTMKPLVVVASSSTYQMPEETVGLYPCMKGSKYVVVTLASVQTDHYAGGYFSLSSAGLSQVGGYTYRIKGNTKTGDPSSGNIRIELYDKLCDGINSSDAFTITGSRYSNLEAGLASTGTDLPAGVNMIPITTAGDYGWVQTKGLVGVKCGASTILAGRNVAMSTATAGAVDLLDVCITAVTSTAYNASSVHPMVGISAANSTAVTYVPIVLTLD